MIDYLNIGPAPADEPCAQIPGEEKRCIRECQIFRRQLEREFPDGQFRVKSFPHDFGTYYEVVALMADEASTNAAFEAESNANVHWDETSLQELRNDKD